MSSFSDRQSRLERLKKATEDYVNAEKKKIEDDVAALEEILDGRTGGQGLRKYPAQAASEFAESDLADFLAGREPEESSTAVAAAPVPTEQVQPETSAAAPQNYSSRKGTKIDMLVIHVTQGSKKSAVAWFKNPAAKVSAHYVVGQDGSVTSCVPEAMQAWHAANSDVNRRSVGIECEGFVDQPAMWASALYGALVRLSSDLCKRYGIPSSRVKIVGHSEVPGASHTDPGQYMPWDRFLADLQAANPGVV